MPEREAPEAIQRPRRRRERGGDAVTDDVSFGRPTVRPALLSRFLGYLAAERGLARNTIDSYRRDLEDAIRFLDRRQRPLEAADADDWRDFIHSATKRRLATRTVSRRVAAVRSLVKFQAVEGLQPATEVQPQGLVFRVQGVEWPYAEKAYLMLHKPAGTECSQKPSTYPSIYTLLPSPLRTRPQKAAVQGVQAVGRLDQDTTGLLLLTDDGKFIHRMSSPRHHVPKVYDVTVKHPLDDAQIRRLLDVERLLLGLHDVRQRSIARRIEPQIRSNDCRHVE